MKRKWMGAVVILVMFTLTPGAGAQDADLKARIEAFYAQGDSFVNGKNLEGIFSLLTDDYQEIRLGMNRRGLRNLLTTLFSSYEGIRTTTTPLEISRYGEFVRVLVGSRMLGKTAGTEWKEIASTSAMEYLRPDGNSFKTARSGEIDRTRLNLIKGRTYADPEAPFAVTAPQGWDIIPGVLPGLKGTVVVLAPDMSGMALMGYLKTPGISPQQAAEGDETLTRSLSQDTVYELYKSGPVAVGPYEGFETESRFHIPATGDRHRRRVYFKAHGSLYVLCFDALPSDRWDDVKDGFQSILASIKVED